MFSINPGRQMAQTIQGIFIPAEEVVMGDGRESRAEEDGRRKGGATKKRARKREGDTAAIMLLWLGGR